MELFEPQSFFQMAGLLAGILTGAVAVAGLCIALMTYRAAVSALDVWKSEKHFDIELEAKSKMGEALTILNKLNKTFFPMSDLDEGQKFIADEIDRKYGDSGFVSVYRLQSGYHNHFFNKVELDLVKLRQVSMKAISYCTDDDVKEFYLLWSYFEGHIYNTLYNYTSVKLDSFAKQYNDPFFSFNGELLPLPVLTALKENGYSNEDAVEYLFEDLKNITKADRYQRMLQIYAITYFPKIFHNLTHHLHAPFPEPPKQSS